MQNITDWIMVVITIVYVIATIVISKSNRMAANAARDAVEESKRQFTKSIGLQKQHNYDSVRPAISIDFISSDSNEKYSGQISITNHGLGPAVIKGLYFKKDMRNYINTNGYCTLYDLVRFRIEEEHLDLHVREVFNQCYTKEFRDDEGNKDYLAVGEKLTLLGFKARNSCEGEIVGKVFHDVQMELVYTDLYNSRIWKTTNRLSYFKPNWIERRDVGRAAEE